MNELLQQYGGYGIAVALAGFVMYLLREHKRERKEWLSSIEKFFDKVDEKEDKQNEITRDITNVLSGLKTLFEVHIRGGSK